MRRLPRSMLRASASPATALARPLLLALLLAALPAASMAQGQVPPYPPEAARTDSMRAPGALSGPRVPLGHLPRAGFGHLLARPVDSTPQPLFLGMLRFWRGVVSPVDGNDADLAPVPSLYAVHAIQTHGVLLGTALTTARLIDEPSKIPHTPRFSEHGREFHYDPLHWNTYWLPGWLRGE